MRAPPLCHTIREVSPGALPLIRTCWGSTATVSARSSLATETRWIGRGLSMIIDLPTVTTSFSTPAGPDCCVAPLPPSASGRL